MRHESVLALLKEALPHEKTAAEVMRRKARAIIAKHRNLWTGPPFCPADLADMEGIFVQPAQCDILSDGRIFSKGGKVYIEYRPDQTEERRRFTIGHELAHTLFPDCYRRERRRSAEEKADYEFEDLCNIGASEFLFPLEEFSEDVGGRALAASELLNLAKRYNASVDATAQRFVALHPNPACVVFARYQPPTGNSVVNLVVKYSVPNSQFRFDIHPNLKINSKSAANTAYKDQIPFGSAKENWRIRQDWGRFRSEAIPLPKFASKNTSDLAIILYPV